MPTKTIEWMSEEEFNAFLEGADIKSLSIYARDQLRLIVELGDLLKIFDSYGDKVLAHISIRANQELKRRQARRGNQDEKTD